MRELGPRNEVGELRFGQVSVIDGLLDADACEAIAELLDQPIWSYGWRSDARRDIYPFWHVHFAGGDQHSRVDCEKELARLRIARPIYRLWTRLKKTTLTGHVPIRVYANAHTYGVEGYVHRDSDNARNYFTTLFYAHRVWDKNWAGETVFYRPDGSEIATAVYPKPGRIVSFRGAIPHCARAPSRECAALRLIVAIKTRLKRP